MKRITRTVVAALSFAVIGLVARSQEAFARDGCYACGCGNWYCEMQCPGPQMSACIFDNYGFCDESEWGPADWITPCYAD